MDSTRMDSQDFLTALAPALTDEHLTAASGGCGNLAFGICHCG